MPNVRLVIEYDGSRFSGWQIQPSLRTIQGELHRILELVTRQSIAVVQASGRTDAGVHARAQVVNFFLQEEVDLRRLAHSVSHLMQGELAVISAEYVPNDFHSRFSAEGKTYCYHILARTAPPVLDRGYIWHVPYAIDVELMIEQAKLLEGQHDFSSFQASGCAADSAVKRIFKSQLWKEDDRIYYRVHGSGFLKQMVRNIVGTLVDIGRGRLNTTIPEILAQRDREKAGVCAPARGLYLEKVDYPSSDKAKLGC